MTSGSGGRVTRAETARRRARFPTTKQVSRVDCRRTATEPRDSGPRRTTIQIAYACIRVCSSYRTLSTYLNVDGEAGFALERVYEPQAPRTHTVGLGLRRNGQSTASRSRWPAATEVRAMWLVC